MDLIKEAAPPGALPVVGIRARRLPASGGSGTVDQSHTPRGDPATLGSGVAVGQKPPQIPAVHFVHPRVRGIHRWLRGWQTRRAFR